MAIEVRQLTIRSFVSGDRDQERARSTREDTEKIKEEILRECREIVRDMVRAERER